MGQYVWKVTVQGVLEAMTRALNDIDPDLAIRFNNMTHELTPEQLAEPIDILREVNPFTPFEVGDRIDSC